MECVCVSFVEGENESITHIERVSPCGYDANEDECIIFIYIG